MVARPAPKNSLRAGETQDTQPQPPALGTAVAHCGKYQAPSNRAQTLYGEQEAVVADIFSPELGV